MNKLIFLSAWLSIACGAGGINRMSESSNSAAAKTNLAGNSTPYSQTENAYSVASNSPLGNLKASVGKTANEVELWRDKKIDAELKRLMGPDYARMKKFWNVETPIKKYGDFLMMSGCEQHNCGDNQYVILMDTADGIINVVHIGPTSTREWKDRHIQLPPPLDAELASMKGDK